MTRESVRWDRPPNRMPETLCLALAVVRGNDLRGKRTRTTNPSGFSCSPVSGSPPS